MSVAAYTAGTVLDGADSRRTPAFRVLALGLLGMDGRCGGVRILLCSGFSNSADGTQAGCHATSVKNRLDKERHPLGSIAIVMMAMVPVVNSMSVIPVVCGSRVVIRV